MEGVNAAGICDRDGLVYVVRGGQLGNQVGDGNGNSVET